MSEGELGRGRARAEEIAGRDLNNDGVIQWEEFRTAVRQTEASILEEDFFSAEALKVLGVDSFSDDALRKAFDAADTDRSGALDAAELSRLLVSTCPALAGSAEHSPPLLHSHIRGDGKGTALPGSIFPAFSIYLSLCLLIGSHTLF